ncbi:hypothetical protein RxyAA322_30650 [Rubrobacter xylanophilus]|uniref:Uncharacterized protein n=1 Tax=Rubrobacter xylanophilus TaxID=49319 RepID=A0A510HMI9_9ACTN|nr:hypothetical protein [Rubrobacter xylanophilus]BBL81211.1 hypothetical protein RxyAA322_30650 [Rubrobacter xylanophilus]
MGFRRRFGTVYALVDEGSGEVSYALKSGAEDLGRYVGQHVRLSGYLVEGFPAEPGDAGCISVVRILVAYHPE